MVTSITGSEALNALTGAEADQLCADENSFFARSISKSDRCKFEALAYLVSKSTSSDADLRIICSSTEDACTEPDAGADAGTTTCYAIPSACDATVAQYADCVEHEASSFNQTVSTLPSCSTVTQADTAAIYRALDDNNLPASCLALATACPDLVIPIPN